MAARTTARRDGLGLLRTEFNEQNPEISPDGNWLASRSNASGQFEVYVRPFPDVDSGRGRSRLRAGSNPCGHQTAGSCSISRPAIRGR